MTLDLGNDMSVTVNTFHGKLWLTIQANGGRLGVAMDAEVGKQLGAEMFNAARIEARRKADEPLR
jgi:hypothetical protein